MKAASEILLLAITLILALTPSVTFAQCNDAECLAGASASASGDLLALFWSRSTDWNYDNVSAITGQRVVSPVTRWQVQDGPLTIENLAGVSPSGDLLVFYWSPRADWQVVNVSAITGQRVVGPVTNWQVQDGPLTIENLAGVSPSGDLLVFYWSPRADWQVVNVSRITGQQVANVSAAITGQQVAHASVITGQQVVGLATNRQVYGQQVVGPVTNWQVREGPLTVGESDCLNQCEMAFDRCSREARLRPLELIQPEDPPRPDPEEQCFQNVRECRESCPAAEEPPSMQVQEGPLTVENLAGVSPSGDLLVFYRSPRADWQVVNVSRITGQQVVGPVTNWQVREGPLTVENLAGVSPSGDLLVFYRSPRADWQVVNVSRITGRQVVGPVTSYLTDVGNDGLVATGLNDKGLYVFWNLGFGRAPNPGWGYCDISGRVCTRLIFANSR